MKKISKKTKLKATLTHANAALDAALTIQDFNDYDSDAYTLAAEMVEACHKIIDAIEESQT